MYQKNLNSVLKYCNLNGIMIDIQLLTVKERAVNMQKKNIIPIVAIVLAFVLICASLCCAFIAIGSEFGLYNKFFGDDSETPQASISEVLTSEKDAWSELNIF